MSTKASLKKIFSKIQFAKPSSYHLSHQSHQSHEFEKKNTSPKSPTRWWFQPIWKIWSSHWIISPGSSKNKKGLKPPPSQTSPSIQVFFLSGASSSERGDCVGVGMHLKVLWEAENPQKNRPKIRTITSRFVTPHGPKRRNLIFVQKKDDDFKNNPKPSKKKCCYNQHVTPLKNPIGKRNLHCQTW